MSDTITPFFASRICHGISNLGSTCYISTSLQCLGHCISFVYPTIAKSIDPNTYPISASLRELYKSTWIKQQVHTPTEFLRAIKPKVESVMNILSQNDVMEFTMLVLDVLNMEIGHAKSHKDTKPNLSGTTKLYDIMDCHWHNSHKLAASYISEIVYGQMINQQKCKLCGHIEHCGDIFCNISLPLAQDHEHLDKMIKAYFEQEIVQINCEKCKLHNVNTNKVVRIWRPPKVLMIHLKRFDHHNRKITSKIDVPATMDLNDYTITNTAPTNYELKAIACHAGSTTYGHYFALVKNPNGSWFMLDDDSQPRQLNTYGDIQSTTFYVLYYEQIHQSIS